MVKDNIYKRAVDKWGRYSQLLMLAEECAECTGAVLKLTRTGREPEYDARLDALAEEVADVEIMVEQFKVMYPGSTEKHKQAKLKRLDGRLREEEVK
jgi:NTP pyrophosphatase (non-canonical NTP hydrolase)